MIFSWLLIQATQPVSYQPYYPMMQQGPTTLSLSAEDLQERFDELYQQDLSGVREIDVSNCQADFFLRELVSTNTTLSSLERINAENTNIELTTLKAIRAMNTKFLLRDLPQYSERFQRSVATITVDITNTKLSRSEELKYSVIEQPVSISHIINYRCGVPSETGAVQIIIRK